MSKLRGPDANVNKSKVRLSVRKTLRVIKMTENKEIEIQGEKRGRGGGCDGRGKATKKY